MDLIYRMVDQKISSDYFPPPTYTSTILNSAIYFRQIDSIDLFISGLPFSTIKCIGIVMWGGGLFEQFLA